MGNCFTKIKPPECKHERLNEHNDRYFAKVQARNSTESTRHWWRRNKLEELPWEAPTLTDPCATSEPEEEKSIVIATSSIDDTIFSQERTSLPVTPKNEGRRRRRLKADAGVDGWQIKRKGNALQLRLANNRFLQLAATSAAMSPITLDSGVRSSASRNHFNPLVSPKIRKEELNSEFESSMSSGMVWVEVARTIRVTAVAMSRTNPSKIASPLLFAVGGEDGVVTLTEIVDEQHPMGWMMDEMKDERSQAD